MAADEMTTLIRQKERQYILAELERTRKAAFKAKYVNQVVALDIVIQNVKALPLKGENK